MGGECGQPRPFEEERRRDIAGMENGCRLLRIVAVFIHPMYTVRGLL